MRAGLAEHAVDWRWSSCAAYMGRKNNKLVDAKTVWRLFGLKNGTARYAAFLAEGARLGDSLSLPVRYRKGLHFVATDRFIRRFV